MCSSNMTVQQTLSTIEGAPLNNYVDYCLLQAHIRHLCLNSIYGTPPWTLQITFSSFYWIACLKNFWMEKNMCFVPKYPDFRGTSPINSTIFQHQFGHWTGRNHCCLDSLNWHLYYSLHTPITIIVRHNMTLITHLTWLFFCRVNTWHQY